MTDADDRAVAGDCIETGVNLGRKDEHVLPLSPRQLSDAAALEEVRAERRTAEDIAAALRKELAACNVRVDEAVAAREAQSKALDGVLGDVAAYKFREAALEVEIQAQRSQGLPAAEKPARLWATTAPKRRTYCAGWNKGAHCEGPFACTKLHQCNFLVRISAKTCRGCNSSDHTGQQRFLAVGPEMPC